MAVLLAYKFYYASSVYSLHEINYEFSPQTFGTKYVDQVKFVEDSL